MKTINNLKYTLLAFALSGLFLTACKKEQQQQTKTDQTVTGKLKLDAVSLTEDFEVGATSTLHAFHQALDRFR